jgi:phage tail assembly protein T
MKLAREFGRPDWRAMLAGMTSTEYGDWKIFYRDNFFHDAQLDAIFQSALLHLNPVFCRSGIIPGQFQHSFPDRNPSTSMIRMTIR